MINPLHALLQSPRMSNADDVWSGTYKIPWNDPEFSARMLREHLTQDHDLASRNARAIREQTTWLMRNLETTDPCRILDLGCGPGLYAPHWLAAGHAYHGLDFGPASIAHARATVRHARASFVLGNMLDTPYGGPHDIVTLLYGELNVFPPEACRTILRKAWDALAPGGRIALEVHTREAVRCSADTTGWYRSDSGLFSDAPHLCLSEGEWYEEIATARQLFHIVELQKDSVQTYASTMQAWTDTEYQTLLAQAGFVEIGLHAEVPGSLPALQTLTARKP